MESDFTNIDGIGEFGMDASKRSELMSLCVKYAHEGKYEEALRVTEVCVKTNPWDVVAINNKADALRGLGRLEEAKEILVWGLTIDPKLAIGWCTLGELQVLAGERFSARLSFEFALTLIGKEDEHYQTIYGHFKSLDELEAKENKL